MIIRKASLEDVGQLAVLVTLFNGNNTTEEQITNRLQAMQSTEQVIVAELDDKLIGFGSLRLVYNFSDDYLYAEVTDLFVHPDFRRMKVAHNILSYIDQLCREKQVPQLILITGFDNPSAQSFYRSVGFTDWALAMKKEF